MNPPKIIHSTVNLISLIVIAITMVSSCAANKYSYISKDEKAFIKIEHLSDQKDISLISSIVPGKTDEGSKSRGLAFALPYIFKLTMNETVRIINKEKAKYIAKYIANTSDDMFYSGTENDADINISNIKIIRTVNFGNIEKDTALIITLGIQQSADGYFLRFYTKNIQVKYTKAKLNPTDNTVDINLHISMIAYWFDGNKEHISQEIGNVSFLYYDVPLNNKLTDDELDKYKSPWFPILPRTAFNSNKFGTGNFLINADITEYDKFTKTSEMT